MSWVAEWTAWAARNHLHYSARTAFGAGYEMGAASVRRAAEPPAAPPPASPEPMPEVFADPTEADRSRGDFGIGFAATATRYAEDIGEPEMPEGWTAVCAVAGAPVAFRRNGPGYRFVTLKVIRQLLATQGLRIIDESSAKVLEAMALIPDGTIRHLASQMAVDFSSTTADALKAELARREKEKRNGQ